MAVKCSNRTLWSTADEDGYPYWVEFEDRPFTKGNSKFMYKGRLNGKGPRSGEYCTLKVFKTIDIAKHEDWNSYINRIEAANKLAAQFNKMMDNQYTVKFVVPTLALIDISSTCTDCIYFLSNTKRIRSDDCVVVEPYIGSKFRKFYRNSPLKGAEYAYILQAFSHFTASQTGNTLVCGLQGQAHGTEFVLTNPIIHSANQEWGPKDQGAHGFRKFFSAHTCNDICRTMGLPDYLETMSVAEEIDQEVVDTGKKSLELTELETSPKRFVSTDNLEPAVSQPDAESLHQTEAQISDTSSHTKETPTILQTPPMSRVGRTISAPVSMGISFSRSSSVTGPPEFAEDLPSESISRPPTESVILDATPIDDIATHLSDTTEVLPPPSSEYQCPFTPCQTVNEYLELRKNHASFSPGSESIPMIDDELACAESELMEAVPPPTDDFEPTISPSLNSYLKDKESLEIIPHGSMDLDLESQQSISVFEDNFPAPDLGSMNNLQMSPRESITHNVDMVESHTPCETMSQESLVTTPCGTIRQEVDSQQSIVSTHKDSELQDLVPVSEPLIEASNYQLPVSVEIPQDIESQVCLVSIPPDCMDHHLDTVESLEALSPASEKLTSVEVMAEPKLSLEEPGVECMEPGISDVPAEQIRVQECSETQTVQETGRDSFETYPLDNVEVGVQKSVSVDSISSDFKQSLETIPEGSNESDSAQSLDTSEMPTEVQDDTTAVDNNDRMIADNQTNTGFNGQEETSSGIQPRPTMEAPETGVTEETVTCETAASEGVIVEPAIETAGEEGANICEETTIEKSAEPVCEATVSQETSVETNVEPVGESMASQEATVESSVEPVAEDMASQETTVEAGAMASQETTMETSVEPEDDATASEETAVETIGAATTSEDTAVETVGEATTSEETHVETLGEATTSEETNVETVGEATTSEETNVETIGEATTFEETNVETVGEATTSEETNVETVGEATTSQETTVETVGEATTSQETTVETVGEATSSQETAVETAGEATTSQETTYETTSQETNVETVGEATSSQETTVETSEPVAEGMSSQETTVEPVCESAVQESAVETGMESQDQEPAIEKTTIDTTEESYVNQEVMEPTVQQGYVCEDTQMGEANVCQDTTTEINEEANVCQQNTVDCTREDYIMHDNVVETTREEDINQETAVETMSENNMYQSCGFVYTAECTEGNASQDSTMEATGDGYVCQNTWPESTAGETFACQETVDGSAVGVTDVYENSGFGTTVGTIGEGYVCQDSAGETTVEGSKVTETTEGVCVNKDAGFEPAMQCYTNENIDFESSVEPSADGYTSQDSGFGSVVDSNPTGYPNPEQSFTVTSDSNPGSNRYFQSFASPASSYPTESTAATSSQPTDPYYYGLPPEYRIYEDCRSSQCEAGCPPRTTKMTIIPDLDSMEHVETKCLDSVCEERDMQQGIETLPRRKVSYYLEPQESHEIITFRINIAPEYPTHDQNPNGSVYQNVGTVRQSSNTGESSLGSADYCSSCQARETTSAENVAETSGHDTCSYHYSDTSDCMEIMPQRSCGYSSEVNQNVSADWSPTHSAWDDSHCSTAQNQQTASSEKVYSKLGPNV